MHKHEQNRDSDVNRFGYMLTSSAALCSGMVIESALLFLK
jgi:hypothetical protein